MMYALTCLGIWVSSFSLQHYCPSLLRVRGKVTCNSVDEAKTACNAFSLDLLQDLFLNLEHHLLNLAGMEPSCDLCVTVQFCSL